MASLRSKFRPWFAARCAGLAGGFVLGIGLSFGQATNSCLECHSALPDPLGVTPELFSQDIHAQKGLTCVSCHGGDPASDDPDKSMGPQSRVQGQH